MLETFTSHGSPACLPFCSGLTAVDRSVALRADYISDDIQDSFGYLHYAYLAIFVSDKPVSLRPVVGITPPLTTMETP